MSRVKIGYSFIRSSDGSIVPAGTPCYVYERGTQTLATLYAASTGSGTTANPTPVAGGFVQAYVETGSYDLTVVVDGETSGPVPFEAILATDIGVGPAGQNGSTILSGEGAPASDAGINGDFYLDTAAIILYGPKADGAWPDAGTSLKGPATFTYGPVASRPVTGADEQLYFGTDTGLLYQYQETTWSSVAVSPAIVATGLAAAIATAEGASDAAGTAAGDVSTERGLREAADALLIPVSEKGSHGGVASLDGSGLLPTGQLPPLALTDPYVVSSEAAQLALTVHKGDFAIRTDVGKTYVQNGGTSGTMADWTELPATGEVQSVNGHTGTVSLTAADVAAIPTSAKAAASGVGSLDSEGHQVLAQVPPSVESGSAAGATAVQPSSLPYKFVTSFNGATDGTVILAALAALGGPGTVILPSGTAVVDQTIKLGAGQCVIGTGAGTVLKAKAGLEANVIEVVPGTSKTACQGVTVANLTVDGNNGSNSVGKGIVWVGTGNTLNTKEAANGISLENVWVRFCAEDGVLTENTTNGITNVFENVQSYWNKGNGFEIKSSDGMYSNCYAEKNGLAGWVVGGNAALSHFANCSGSDSGQVTAASGHGWKITSGACSFANCWAQDNKAHGFFVTEGGATDNSFSGCLADSNSYENAAGEFSGFYLDTNTKRSTIVGCHSRERFEAAKYQAYGYYLAGSTSGNYIASTAYNNLKGGVVSVSTGTENVLGLATTKELEGVGGSNAPGGKGANLADRAMVTTAGEATATLTESGKSYGVRIPVQAGTIINAINVCSGTTEGTNIEHSWAALYTTAWQKLAVSADVTTTPWAKKTLRTFTLEAPYVVPVGVNAIYVFLVVVHTGVMPTFVGLGTGELPAIIKEAEPAMAVNGKNGLTTPSSAPAEMSVHTATGKGIPYVWLT